MEDVQTFRFIGEQKTNKDEKKEAEKVNMGISEIFKRKDIFVNLLIMAVIWATTSFNFYLMSF